MAAVSASPLNSLEAFRVFVRSSLIRKPEESRIVFFFFSLVFFLENKLGHTSLEVPISKNSIYSYRKSVGAA